MWSSPTRPCSASAERRRPAPKRCCPRAASFTSSPMSRRATATDVCWPTSIATLTAPSSTCCWSRRATRCRTPIPQTSPTPTSSSPPPAGRATSAAVCGAAAADPASTFVIVSLASRLGHADDAKLLIVNCDDLGSSHAANVGVYEALRDGVATSATLMVPCPWAREAASRYRGEDVGVHLTLNAEYDLYRWGPITQAPSLLDGDGGFPRTLEDVWDHADLEEVRRECRAQVERAIYWGFDVSHLDSHMGTLQLRPEFFDVYLELAVDFGLPLRLSGSSSERLIGFPFRKLAGDEGVLFPDHLLYVPGVGSRRAIERALADLRPGVTEVYVHPAVDTPELRAFAPDWAARVDDHDLITGHSTLRALAERAGATLIGYRELRDLQRRA